MSKGRRIETRDIERAIGKLADVLGVHPTAVMSRLYALVMRQVAVESLKRTRAKERARVQ